MFWRKRPGLAVMMAEGCVQSTAGRVEKNALSMAREVTGDEWSRGERLKEMK